MTANEFLGDIERRVANLIRVGMVSAVSGGKVRVKTGSLQTGYLPYMTTRAGDCVTYWQPSINEQVLILSPSGELNNGIVLPAIYTQDNTPQDQEKKHTTIYDDGTSISYDWENQKLDIVTDGEINITASKVNIIGNLNIDGKVSATADIKSDSDVKATNISLKNHHHISGNAGSPTTTPQ